MISGQQLQPNYQLRIQGSKGYQSSSLCSGLLFLFGEMVFVIILIDFFHYWCFFFFFFSIIN